MEPVDGKTLDEVVGFVVILSAERFNLEIVQMFLQAANTSISY